MSDQLTPPGTQPLPAAGSQPGAPAGPTPSYGQPPVPAYAGPPTAPSPSPSQGQYWAPPPPPVQQGYVTPAKRGNGLAVTAVVLSALALLVSVGVVVILTVGSASAPGGALSGQVTPVDKGVAGNDLQAELTKIITDDGGSVDTITCPAHSEIGQGLVTVCKGSVGGYDWTGIVVFEDAEGRFVLNEL